MPLGQAIASSLLSASKKSLKDSSPRTQGQEYSGYYQSDILGPNPSYNLKESENIIQGKHNTIILMGS